MIHRSFLKNFFLDFEILYIKVCIGAYGQIIFMRIKPNGRRILTNPVVKDRKGPILLNYVIK